MPLGPGKYDAQASKIREELGGSVILIVLDGKHGSGFSVQSPMHVIPQLPAILRQVAEDMEPDIQEIARKILS